MNKPLISDRLDDQEWRYHVEIEASTGKAKIAIFDETDEKIGYL